MIEKTKTHQSQFRLKVFMITIFLSLGFNTPVDASKNDGTKEYNTYQDTPKKEKKEFKKNKSKTEGKTSKIEKLRLKIKAVVEDIFGESNKK